VLAHAWEPIDGALADHHYGPAAGDGLTLAAGLGVGLVGLVYFDRWVANRDRPAYPPGTGPERRPPRRSAATAPGPTRFAGRAGWRC
jgi:zinc transporter, ZIP family